MREREKRLKDSDRSSDFTDFLPSIETQISKSLRQQHSLSPLNCAFDIHVWREVKQKKAPGLRHYLEMEVERVR